MARRWLLGALLPIACSRPSAPPQEPAPVPAAPAATRVVVESVTVRDPELERRLTRVELTLWERDAQVEDLEARLREARDEVVRAMAKVQTLATRAEAASGMAEADVAIQALRGAEQAPEARQAAQLMTESTTEFNAGNYAGALYLANQARLAAGQGRRRLAAERTGARPGEVSFVLPIKLKTVSRGNVREGPGTNFPVVLTLEGGVALTGISYLGDWLRVTDDGGQTGWIAKPLVGRN